MAQPEGPALEHVEILDGLQNLDLLGRRMSRRVLRESGAVWASIWDEVIRIQDTNPDVRRIAEGKTDDPEQAIRELAPQLMLLNPHICRGVAAFCHGVVDELGYSDEAVSPACEAPAETGDGDLDVEQDAGGQQAVDRLAELEGRCERLEQWHADLEDEVVRLRSVVRNLGAQAERPTNVA